MLTPSIGGKISEEDKETIIDAEFKAQAKIDTEGTLIIYKEEIA